MKKPLYITLAAIPLFLFFACHKKQLQEKPAHLIPYEKTIEIVAYSYIIESEVLLSRDLSDSAKLAYSAELYHSLFEKYAISKEQYASSVEFYLKDEDQANKLNQDVSAKLEELRVFYTGEEPEDIAGGLDDAELDNEEVR